MMMVPPVPSSPSFLMSLGALAGERKESAAAASFVASCSRATALSSEMLGVPPIDSEEEIRDPVRVPLCRGGLRWGLPTAPAIKGDTGEPTSPPPGAEPNADPRLASTSVAASVSSKYCFLLASVIVFLAALRC